MHCSLSESPDPAFQLLPLTGYVTLDQLLNLQNGSNNNFHRITLKIIIQRIASLAITT